MRFQTGDMITGEDDGTGEMIVGIIRGLTQKAYRVQWLDVDPSEGVSYIRFTAERFLQRCIVSFAGPVQCGPARL
jgi:hypothetical protein